MSPDLAAAAFQYTLQGLAVFPLAPGSKIPLGGSHGYLDASVDPDIAVGRWRENPTANIGCATGRASEAWIVDVDPRNGGDETLEMLQKQHGDLGIVLATLTPSGGMHIWWRWPTNVSIRNSTSRIGPGIDVRAEGGYCILPPSLLSNGECYAWSRLTEIPLEFEYFSDTCVIRDRLVAAPNWLIQMALPSPPPVRTEPVELPRDTERYVKVAVDSELARLVKGIENRNHTLNDVAFHLGEFIGGGYIPHDWAEQELTQRAITIGLPPSEAAKTIKSGLDAGAAQPRKLSNA